ncbi:hypothetical protein D3C87_1551320 [compost metagenome]
MRQNATRLHLPAQHVEKRRLGGLLPVAQQIGIEQRAMKRHKPCIATDRQVQRGDVAVADERFGVTAQQLEIDVIEQPRRAITTAQANDRIDLVIGERRVQVVEADLIAASQVTLLLVDTGVNLQ